MAVEWSVSHLLLKYEAGSANVKAGEVTRLLEPHVAVDDVVVLLL